MRILYEDADLIVCEKPVGVLSQPDRSGEGEDMPALLREYLHDKSSNPNPYVGLVHRLDRGVGGAMVLAKNERTASALSAAIAAHEVTKQYLAVVHGCPDALEGVWWDYLYRDNATGKSIVVECRRKGSKAAGLSYRVLQTLHESPHGTLSLLQIQLHTGRTHQIRAQCASRGMPLIGDGKYGARDRGVPIGLWSYRLTFAHPGRKNEKVDCRSLPAVPPFHMFGDIETVEKLPVASVKE